MELKPIGTVRSSVVEPEDMPHHGVEAQVEVYSQFSDGLQGIEDSSHILVLGWLHRADRALLRVDRSYDGARDRGVFSVRSSSRPNPLGLSPARLLRREGNLLHLERLDFVDGTPVVDLKRYSPSWDCIFSARSSRDLSVSSERDPRQQAEDMMVETANFHGERCLGVALAVRMMGLAMERWGMAQKEPGLKLFLGEDGCIADGLQALTGATLGNWRLKAPGGRIYRLVRGDQGLAFYPKETEGLSPEAALESDAEDLFAVRDDPPAHAAYVAEKARSTREVDAALLERVTGALVQGKLPCAVAFQIAQEMGVAVGQVGRAADLGRAKISHCQLGCFR